MNKLRILLADDDVNFLRRFKVLGHAHFEVMTATSGHEALRALAEDPPDALLLDLAFREQPDGLAVLRQIREAGSDLPVIIVSDDTTQETAVTAMKAGANDYLSKAPNLDLLHLKIQKVLREVAWREYARSMDDARLPTIVGQSPATRRLREEIARAAACDYKILVSGETGAGKGVVARAIHAAGRRRGEKFIAFNSASAPDEIFESELFGHERGAFTGADRQRIGRFEMASGGTFFLDEVDKLSLQRQAKLLVVVEEGQVDRLGGRARVDLDLRLITAANQDLRAMVAAGTFREDFYYRIAEIEIFVPPLRERREDIPEIARALLLRQSRSATAAPTEITPAALQLLLEQPWRGNIRQLDNTLKRALLFSQSDGTLTEEGVRWALESGTRRPVAGPSDGTPGPDPALFAAYLARPFEQARSALVDDFEREFIGRALAQAGGNKTKVAARLGMSRTKLYERLRELKLEVEE